MVGFTERVRKMMPDIFHKNGSPHLEGLCAAARVLNQNFSTLSLLALKFSVLIESLSGLLLGAHLPIKRVPLSARGTTEQRTPHSLTHSLTHSLSHSLTDTESADEGEYSCCVVTIRGLAARALASILSFCTAWMCFNLFFSSYSSNLSSTYRTTHTVSTFTSYRDVQMSHRHAIIRIPTPTLS
jgi:hypothetical protein